MTQKTIDKTNNDSLDVAMSKISDNFDDLYNTFGGSTDPSVTTVTTSGLATLGSAKVDTGTKTGTATGGAVTLNKRSGVVTSEALTTAAGATYTLTITNSTIAATSQVMASVQLGTATTGMPTVTTVTPGSGSLVIIVQNIHSAAALNGTIKITYIALTA